MHNARSRMLTLSLVVLSALHGLGCAGSDKSVVADLEGGLVTDFEDATATTMATPDGLHTELYTPDGDVLLAVLDLGRAGATWQLAGGVVLWLQAVPEEQLRAIASIDIDAPTTFVAALPTAPAEANATLHDLYRLETASPPPAGDTVPYSACTYYGWDNMDCIVCDGYCCRDWVCSDGNSGGSCDGNCRVAN